MDGPVSTVSPLGDDMVVSSSSVPPSAEVEEDIKNMEPEDNVAQVDCGGGLCLLRA